MTMRRAAIAVILTGFLAASLAPAAGPEEFERVAYNYRASREALHDYTWMQRVKVSIDGKEAGTQVFEVRFDADGRPVRTLQEQTGGRGKKERAIAEDARKAINQLMDAYTHMSPDDFRELFANSAAFEGQGDESGITRLRARDVLRQGDVMNIVVDPSFRMRSFAIETSLQREPLQVEAEFLDLADGPTYLVRSTVTTRHKNKAITLDTENFDHRLAN